MGNRGFIVRLEVMILITTLEVVDLGGITISRHAQEQFCRRWKDVTGQIIKEESVDAFLRSMFLNNLREATEKEDCSLRTKRDDGRYFIRGNWVFVIDDNLSMVITIFWKVVAIERGQVCKAE